MENFLVWEFRFTYKVRTTILYPFELFRLSASYFLVAKSNRKPPGESKNLRADMPVEVVFWV